MQVVISSENTNKRRLGLGWGALFQIRYSGKPESDKMTIEKKPERSKDLGCTNIKDKSIPARENSIACTKALRWKQISQAERTARRWVCLGWREQGESVRQ